MDFSSLSKKYHGFNASTAKVEIGGIDIFADKDCTATEIVVSMSALEPRRASAASVTVTEMVSVNKLEKIMQAGETVKISLGYGAALSQVFYGYIHDMSVSRAGKMFSYTLMCLDVKGLMTLGGSYRLDGKKKLPAVIKEICGNYSSFVTETKLGTIPDCLPAVVQGVSDFEFLSKWAELLGFYFFSQSGVLYFTGNLNGETVTLDYYDGIEEYTITSSLNGQVKEVTLVSYDDTGKQIKANVKRSSEKGTAHKKLPSVLKGNKEIVLTSLNTQAQLNALKQGQMNIIQRNFCRISAECVGIPELVPPNILLFNGNWLICGGRHVFDEDGYRTYAEGIAI
jgi:phage protein D